MSSERRERYEAWNQVADADALWGPLVFLRPEQDQKLTRGRLLVVVSLFGSVYGLCSDVMLHFIHLLARLPVPAFGVLPLSLSATAYVCGELTFLRAWNDRAHFKQRRESWFERQGNGAPRFDAD